MTRSKITLLLVVLLSTLIAGTASAQYNCSAAPTYVLVGPNPYWDYTKNPLTSAGDASCWIVGSGWTSGTLNGACSTDTDGWEFLGGNNKSMTHTFTVGASDSGSSNWNLGFNVDFSDPNNDWYSQLVVQVQVTHNGSTTTHSIYTRNGSQGSDCGWKSGSFTAVNGDTVKVVFRANDYLGANILFNNVSIIRWQY
jgi:hypothetical protein